MPAPQPKTDAELLAELNLLITDPYRQQNTAARLRKAFRSRDATFFNKASDKLPFAQLLGLFDEETGLILEKFLPPGSGGGFSLAQFVAAVAADSDVAASLSEDGLKILLSLPEYDNDVLAQVFFGAVPGAVVGQVLSVRKNESGGFEYVVGGSGPAGRDGTSVTIVGNVPTAAALPTNLTPTDAGKGYLTDNDGHLHVWSGSAFTDVGEIRGPQGVPGQPGPAGNGLSPIQAGDLLNLLNEDYWQAGNHGEYIGPNLTTPTPAEYYRSANSTRTGLLLRTDGTPRGVSRFFSL